MTRSAEAPEELARRLSELTRRLAAEQRLVHVAGTAGGVAGLIRAAGEMSNQGIWLIDTGQRIVARSAGNCGTLVPPDLAVLLGEENLVHPASMSSARIETRLIGGTSRRHIVMPVNRGDTLFGCLAIVEGPGRFPGFDQVLLERAAVHIDLHRSAPSSCACGSSRYRARPSRFFGSPGPRPTPLQSGLQNVFVSRFNNPSGPTSLIPCSSA
jgi:hypothetical protein